MRKHDIKRAYLLNKEGKMFNIMRISFLLAATLLCTNLGWAQINNVEALMRGGLNDANLLLEAYLSPFGRGFGADLNNGWFNTARTHKFLGFDLTVTANAAIAPISAKTFDLSTLGLQNLRLDNSNADPNTPTVVGDEQPGPEMTLVLNNPATGQDQVISRFRMPQGIGFRAVPSAMIQASLGIVSNTDVILRFFPETEFDSDVGKLRLFGLGVKHDLSQWLPGGGFLPFDLSILAGYTVFQVQSGDISLQPDPDAVPTGATYSEQKVEIEATSYTVNLLVSKQLAILTLFGAIGIESSSVDLRVKGTYPVTVIDDDPSSPHFGQKIIEDFVDPTNISFDGVNNRRATVGIRLHLLLLTLHGSYTFSSYPVATLGVGLSIR